MLSWSNLFCVACLSAASVAASPSGAQQVAGSVEAGLQTLAQELLASAPTDRRPAISVLPFPGADQSCPVLSVFVVDELTTTFVRSVQPRPRVVERQQLEAIIAQNRLDEFLTDPEQRRRLGGLSGIGAVVLGTFAGIGDRLRINARMVAIDTGETIGAASVSVPRTREMEDLLRQGSGRGVNCLPDVRPSGGGGSRPTPLPVPPRPGENCFQDGPLEACGVSLSGGASSSDRSVGAIATVVVRLRNVGEAPVGVLIFPPRPTLVATDGSSPPFVDRGISGVNWCDEFNTSWAHPHICQRWDRSQFTRIAPGRSVNISLRFQGALSNEASASVSANLLFYEDRKDAETERNPPPLKVFGLSLDGLRPSSATRR